MVGKAFRCDGDGMTDSTITELHHRSADGIEVSLLWNELENSLRVVVVDARAGTAFEVTAPQDNALDVFYHPYAHAAQRGIDYLAGATASSASTEALAA